MNKRRGFLGGMLGLPILAWPSKDTVKLPVPVGNPSIGSAEPPAPHISTRNGTASLCGMEFRLKDGNLIYGPDEKLDFLSLPFPIVSIVDTDPAGPALFLRDCSRTLYVLNWRPGAFSETSTIRAVYHLYR